MKVYPRHGFYIVFLIVVLLGVFVYRIYQKREGFTDMRPSIVYLCTFFLFTFKTPVGTLKKS